MESKPTRYPLREENKKIISYGFFVFEILPLNINPDCNTDYIVVLRLPQFQKTETSNRIRLGDKFSSIESATNAIYSSFIDPLRNNLKR